MRIFIDIGHPAHVHYFRNFIKIMQLRGHEFFVTARDRKHVFSLLSAYGIDATNRGAGANSRIGKLLYMIKADLFLYQLARRFNPDLFLHFGAVYASHVASFLGRADIFFDDTENARMNQKFYVPFADLICTPSCFRKDLGKKHVRFSGYMELCYLHPSRFVADKSIFRFLGIDRRDPFVILRFVSWEAGHDYGHTGLDLGMKRKAVREFSKYATVFIDSEKELPDDLRRYQISIPSHMMHSALYYATLLYGESATMASECAVLGTPAIYLDNEGRGYTDEQEKKYGMVFNFTESMEDQELSIRKAIELLKTPDVKKVWQEKKEKMLSEKIDVTAFMVWLVENYPESVRIMKENPDYQYRFK